jgi:hypothetical protein
MTIMICDWKKFLPELELLIGRVIKDRFGDGNPLRNVKPERLHRLCHLSPFL